MTTFNFVPRKAHLTRMFDQWGQNLSKPFAQGMQRGGQQAMQEATQQRQMASRQQFATEQAQQGEIWRQDAATTAWDRGEKRRKDVEGQRIKGAERVMGMKLGPDESATANVPGGQITRGAATDTDEVWMDKEQIESEKPKGTVIKIASQPKIINGVTKWKVSLKQAPQKQAQRQLHDQKQGLPFAEAEAMRAADPKNVQIEPYIDKNGVQLADVKIYREAVAKTGIGSGGKKTALPTRESATDELAQRAKEYFAKKTEFDELLRDTKRMKILKAAGLESALQPTRDSYRKLYEHLDLVVNNRILTAQETLKYRQSADAAITRIEDALKRKGRPDLASVAGDVIRGDSTGIGGNEEVIQSEGPKTYQQTMYGAVQKLYDTRKDSLKPEERKLLGTIIKANLDPARIESLLTQRGEEDLLYAIKDMFDQLELGL